MPATATIKGGMSARRANRPPAKPTTVAAMAEAMIGPTLRVCESRYTSEPAKPPMNAAVNARRSA